MRVWFGFPEHPKKAGRRGHAKIPAAAPNESGPILARSLQYVDCGSAIAFTTGAREQWQDMVCHCGCRLGATGQNSAAALKRLFFSASPT
ncbi:hypothetical protein A4R29_04730 [Mesorhizobium ciceri biovar biserrulae]|nr:hypothetical protein A4R29_04730 [Mesorhizobium ciceri biovar biserrulae]